jgi:flavin-binding protein dodecin
MADPVYKIVDVVGTSEQSISNAIGNAIDKPLERCETLAGSRLSKFVEIYATARLTGIR